MENLSIIKVDDIVKVIGIVNYGDVDYDVDCIGVVNMINKDSMLITLEEINQDKKVSCLVKNKYIEPISIAEIGKELTGKDFKTKEDFLQYLSEEFEEKLDKFDDAQFAYDDLNRDYSYYLNNLGCVYSLFNGESWTVKVNKDILNIVTLEKLKELLQDNSIKDIEDIESCIENRVSNNMCNCGIDVYNALELELNILDEKLKPYIKIESNGNRAKIEIL